jgi:TusA-related sulfurtransferase
MIILDGRMPGTKSSKPVIMTIHQENMYERPVRLSPGALLRVIATDPGSERDFEMFSRQSGHALLDFHRDGEAFVYLLKKKDGS